MMPHDPTIWNTSKLFSSDSVAEPLLIASELKFSPAVEVDDAQEHLKRRTLERLNEVLR
ncbi:hypothetical protein ACR5KS_03925 [Leucobacter sp. W1153]|uniref:hypothetical protein n=1 Tax=Leucobacter sp. W1153 TaxID=3439064 RepID=UPI003F35951C